MCGFESMKFGLSLSEHVFGMLCGVCRPDLFFDDHDELLTCMFVNVYDPELHRKLWGGCG